MTDSKRNAEEPGDLRGPGDPDAVEQEQPQPQAGTARNIREEQMTQAGGTVPASYVGSGTPEGEPKPEEAAGESGLWDAGDR
ncbi:hypothetical protein ACFRAU_22865 [Arthrobacter sp. NPDC056691]|uniref:hypothetical protein n=1 Tax=unclassified Arthrobacter TaxID=235627 RepID=UPI00366CA48E